MIDNSPEQDEPTFEQLGTWYPSKSRIYDTDGSIRGCADCGRPFGRMQSYAAFVRAGELLFRHVDLQERNA